ncbi:MAG: type II toxin-antitoxin system HicA family toxin [Ignavibacterium sp.]
MEKIIKKILSGTSDANIKFSELRKLIISLDFIERIKGDHFIYYKEGVIEIINLQPQKDGKAKPYQVKQVRNLIRKYKLY